MKEQYRIFVLGLLAALVCSSTLCAQERVGDRGLRGTFVRLAEREVSGEGYLAIVVKPLEGVEPVTLLLPRQQEELGAFARQLQPGQKTEIAYVVERDQNWVRRIEAERRPRPEEREQAPMREPERQQVAQHIEKAHAKLAELKEAAERAEREGRREEAAELREKALKMAQEIEAFARKAQGRVPAEAKQRIEQLRDMARQAKERGEMEKAEQFWAEADELERTLKREPERREMVKRRPEEMRLADRDSGLVIRGSIPDTRFPIPRPGPMEPERRREPGRERPEPAGAWPRLERMQKELHEVLAVNLERMANEFRELQMHVQRLERELQDLRAENERLRRELRDRDRLASERPREIRQQREPVEPEQRRERPEAGPRE